MKKKVIGIFLLFFVLFLLNFENTALAAPNLQVKVSAGIDGKAKYEKGGPITITVENNGTSFSGDIVIDVMDSYNQGAGRVIPLEIGAGETKTVSIIVDNVTGATDMFGSLNAKTIHFYEGGWKKGKEIAHKGTQFITTTTFYDEEKFILTLTNEIDRLSAVRSVNLDTASSVQVTDISKIGTANLPEDAVGLDAIDYIIIDEYPLADISIERQQAIVEWVDRGGILIVGGSNNVQAEVGEVANYLPLTLGEQVEVSPTALNHWIKNDELKEPLVIHAATLNDDGIAVVEDEEHVLIASRKVGKGLILQTAFSLGDAPLANDPNMSSLWKMIFETGNLASLSSYQPSIHEQIRYGLMETNALFSSFKVSAPLIFGIIILYMVLIIPVLYFVLKKKDKREHAWWIIPSIALLTSIAIFGYGAKDRLGRSQVQHSALLHVGENGDVKGYYTESILASKKGEYIFTAPKETKIFAGLSDSLFGSNGNLVHKTALIEEGANETSLHFRNIDFWNVASVYGETTVKDVGNFTPDLQVEKGYLTGTITNDFPFLIQDLSIWSGSHLISLGDLGPGEKITVKEPVNGSVLSSPRSLNLSHMSQSDDIAALRKDSLLSFASEMEVVNHPLLVGYTETKVVPLAVEGKKASTSAYTLLSQALHIENDYEGEVIVNDELLNLGIQMQEKNGSSFIDYIQNPMDDYYYEGVEYIEVWTLPKELEKKHVEWNQLKIFNHQSQLYNSAILNSKTNEYEELKDQETMITKNLEDYMTSDGKIMIRFTLHDGRDATYQQLPQVELSGEVSK